MKELALLESWKAVFGGVVGAIDFPCSFPLNDLECILSEVEKTDFSLKFMLNSGAHYALGEIDKESCPDSSINEKNIAFKKKKSQKWD